MPHRHRNRGIVTVITSALGVILLIAAGVTTVLASDLFTPATGSERPLTASPFPEESPLTGTVGSDDEGGISATEDFTEDYYSVLGTAVLEYDPAPGEIGYCALDELDRAVCAYGLLTGRDGGEREDITFDTPGWTDNAEVTIPALTNIEGSTDYHGWFWNRSHLIADSLGGAAAPENMITGTRTQNVGSTQVHGQFAGGMAHTEVIARDYLDSGAATTCPLYYAATPQYSGEQLVPTGVVVDIQSCDQQINERVLVSNTANGFEINYATGQWRPAD